MRDSYFDEREPSLGDTGEIAIPYVVVEAIGDLIGRRLEDGSLGFGFPEFCADGHGVCGADGKAFRRHVQAMIPDLAYPLDIEEQPPTIPQFCTLLEIVADKFAYPIQGGHHAYFGHYHLTFDRERGLSEWRAAVNVLFRRNHIALEVTEDGTVRRVLAPELEAVIARFPAATGDDHLDRLLDSARRKIVAPDTAVRQEALEELWDAFERLKTLLNPDKRQGVALLLDAAVGGPRMRAALEEEAKALTTLGNTLRIRHHEVEQEAVSSDREADYLFHRLVAFMLLCVRAQKERT